MENTHVLGSVDEVRAGDLITELAGRTRRQPLKVIKPYGPIDPGSSVCGVEVESGSPDYRLVFYAQDFGGHPIKVIRQE